MEVENSGRIDVCAARHLGVSVPVLSVHSVPGVGFVV